MKILAVSNLYAPHSIGGYEERCRVAVDQLRARGHDVNVLTSTHGVGVESEDGPIARRLRIHGFFGHPWLSIYRLYGLERHNHRVLREALATQKPDVVHVWNLGGLSKSLLLTLQEWGGPVVLDVSDHWIARSLRADVWMRWWNGEAGGFAAGVLRRALQVTGLAKVIQRQAPYGAWKTLRFDYAYFCSKSLRSITVAAGWPVGAASVIYCGVDCARFAPRPRSARFSRLLYVGRLHEDKDPLTALRAVAAVRAQGLDVTIDLYGAGDEDYVAKLRAEAARPELAGAVAFCRASADEMPSIYAKYDALLFTSAWQEPFALTPLEAMASRLVVIGTPSGGSQELFRNWENAAVFPARDSRALAETITRVASDANSRARMAETARWEVTTRYDIKPTIDRIEKVLEESRHAR